MLFLLVYLFLTNLDSKVNLNKQMGDLEKHLKKETRIWWDFTILQVYIEKSMIPRGLRIKKIPTIVYSESLLDKWKVKSGADGKKSTPMLI